MLAVATTDASCLFARRTASPCLIRNKKLFSPPLGGLGFAAAPLQAAYSAVLQQMVYFAETCIVLQLCEQLTVRAQSAWLTHLYSCTIP